MNPTMFREYDIRGFAGKDMTEADVELLGKGIGTYLKRGGCRSIAVGRDCRLTSDAYADAVMNGLMAVGLDVTDIGTCPTPVLYFSIRQFSLDGGIMVTASHNPSEYNGFKICHGTDSVHGDQIQEIRQLIDSGDFEAGTGNRRTEDAVTPYHAHVTGNIQLAKPLRIGVDGGNGTAGPVAVPVLEALGCEVHTLYCDMDGRFPNHPADPTVAKNMADLKSLVLEQHLDIGIGFDGDGDRIGVVDRDGTLVHGDRLMIVFAREILERRPGATFIGEVKCSQTMYDAIRSAGGNAIMWRTGHSLIKKKMKTESAALAGEMSGHMFFEDRYFGYDDATYAACRLLEILSASGQSVSELLADVPETVNTPEIRVDCPDAIKFKVVAAVTEHFKQSHDVIDIDGARVQFGDGWGLVRASNTQPALVLRFEADSESRLTEIRNTVESALATIQQEIA